MIENISHLYNSPSTFCNIYFILVNMTIAHKFTQVGKLESHPENVGTNKPIGM